MRKYKIVILFAFALIILISSSIYLIPPYTFCDGRYKMDSTIKLSQRTSNFSDELIYETKNAQFQVISPHDGDIIQYGEINGNTFQASSLAGGYLWEYNGTLLNNNHVVGILTATVKNPEYCEPTLQKGDMLHGAFTIKKIADLWRVRKEFSYLPVVEHDSYHRPHGGCRHIDFMLDAKKDIYVLIIGSLYFFKPEKGVDKRKLTTALMNEILHNEAELYGIDIPINIFADKNLTIDSCIPLFNACLKEGMYRVHFYALHTKWDLKFRFAVELITEKDQKKDKYSLCLKIDKKQIYINDKEWKWDKFKSFIVQVGEYDPENNVYITWTDDTTVQDLMNLLSVLNESFLINKKLVFKNKTIPLTTNN